MITGIPDIVQREVFELLSTAFGKTIALTGFTPAAGGCINNGGMISTAAGNFFLKWNSAHAFPQMFLNEQMGLGLLSSTQVIDIPSVIGSHESTDYQWILMEYKVSGRRSATFWIDLGNQLASLHQFSQTEYGLDHDNYIGSLVQQNKPHVRWIEFFVAQRLTPQLSMAFDSGKVEQNLVKSFERLFALLPGLLPEERPALLHGDLWSGNLIMNENGDPCLIDPAVYFGHREIEIAFTRLFGGMDKTFYQAYHDAYPLTPGFDSRQEIYQLYPLLVHVNLFGGGYVDQVKAILKNF